MDLQNLGGLPDVMLTEPSADGRVGERKQVKAVTGEKSDQLY